MLNKASGDGLQRHIGWYLVGMQWYSGWLLQKRPVLCWMLYISLFAHNTKQQNCLYRILLCIKSAYLISEGSCDTKA